MPCGYEGRLASQDTCQTLLTRIATHSVLEKVNSLLVRRDLQFGPAFAERSSTPYPGRLVKEAWMYYNVSSQR